MFGNAERLFRQISRVVVTDTTQWQPSKNMDGGCYSFETEYIRVGEVFEIHYFTSSDFFYCEKCGSWGNPQDHSDCKFQSISPLELYINILKLSKKYFLQASFSIEKDTLYIFYDAEGTTNYNDFMNCLEIIEEIRQIGDIKKLRRKIEDKLRKSREREIIEVAIKFGF